MKNLRTAVLCAGIVCLSCTSFAQEHQAPLNEPNRNKPRLFTQLPDRIDLRTDAISDLFNAPVGQPASFSLADDNRSQFQGDVISAGMASSNVQRLVIRSTNFPGATFSVSKITQDDGSVVYRGRIISFSHGDVFILENKEGRYQLVKKNFYDLVNE